MISFQFHSEQMEKYSAWKEEHDKACALKNNIGAIGGRLTYSFTPTGLGIIVKAECACGEGCDVTDYENW